jgi:hypothetical protein
MHVYQCITLALFLYDSITVTTGSKTASPLHSKAGRVSPPKSSLAPPSDHALGRIMVPSSTRSFSVEPAVEVIPSLLRPWISLYRSFPKIHAPFTDHDVLFTLVSAVGFAGLDYGVRSWVRWVSGWPLKETQVVAGSLITIIHGSVLVALLPTCLTIERYSPSRRFDSHPKWWQDASTALIQFCSGYMVSCVPFSPRFVLRPRPFDTLTLLVARSSCTTQRSRCWWINGSLA